MAIDRVNEGPRHPDIGEHLLSISNAYIQLHDPVEATRTAREALDILSHSLVPNHHDVLAAERQLASSLALGGNFKEADPLFQQALNGLAQEPTVSQTQATALMQYGDSLRDQGRLPEALEKYQAALKVVATLFPTPNAFWASSHFGIAATFYKMGNQKEAETSAREALRLNTQLFGEAHVRTMQTQVLLARILLRQGKTTEVKDLLARCKGHATGNDAATQQVISEANGLMQTARLLRETST